MSDASTQQSIESMKQATQAILKDEIKHLHLVPPVAIKLLQLTNNEDTNVDSLARVIETEPTLAANILKHINSVSYALPNPITSISRAVAMLGFASVRRLALDLLLFTRLGQKKSSTHFNFLHFWQHSLYVASLSRRIAIAINHPDPDLIYTGGLLHDIGKVVLESHGLTSYGDFICSVASERYSCIKEERNFFGVSHTDIGLIFCMEWQLPTSITAMVAFHHDLSSVTSEFTKFNVEIAIVSFANYVAWVQGISLAVTGHPNLGSEVFECFELNQIDLDPILQQVDQDLQSTQEFYGIELPNLASLRATLVKTTIGLSQLSDSSQNGIFDNQSSKHSASYLTIPHHSLNPTDFIPETLEAIKAEFHFDRCILFTIEPKHRCLVTSFCWPPAAFSSNAQPIILDINQLSGSFLKGLREKQAVIINRELEAKNPLFDQLSVDEFLITPVLKHTQLIAVLYADCGQSKLPMSSRLTREIAPIAYELGIALFNAKQYGQEQKHAQFDHLTQLYNKRMINNYLSELFHEPYDKLSHVAIGFLDLDKFKSLNDSCGHQAGDDALKIVAEILRNLTRPGDLIGRYGGEEFLFVLRETSKEGAYGYAERIRAEIERRGHIMSQRFRGHQITVSIGIAFYNQRYTDYLMMIDAADQAMYSAKHQGRNRVVLQIDE